MHTKSAMIMNFPACFCTFNLAFHIFLVVVSVFFSVLLFVVNKSTRAW